MPALRAAIYCRVSTTDQTVENQRIELQRYCDSRGWTVTEYLDAGVSGAKESRPALDRLLTDARRRRFDTLVVWKLDRLGRNLRHLILLLDELTALGVAFVSLNEGIDTSTPAGRLQLHILGAIAEFERERIRERVKLGMARAKAQGIRLGRKPFDISAARFDAVAHLSLRDAATELGVSRSVVHRWRLSRKAEISETTFASKRSAIPAAAGEDVPSL